jgi:hypothetical protein
MDAELEALQSKTDRNELRARDAEARLRIIEAEIAIIEQRERLEAMRKG